MKLAPRVMMLRNVGNVSLQSSSLECECTCEGEKTESGGTEEEGGVHSPEARSRRWRGIKLSPRTGDSVEAPDWHRLQGALKRTFHIKSVI